MYNKLLGQSNSITRSPKRLSKAVETRGRSQSNLDKNIQIYRNQMANEIYKMQNN